MKKNYFDYNSTTPVDPRVQKIMSDTIQHYFGNPSSMHSHGRKAKELIGISRHRIADFIGASQNEIYFTSGGTESNNWVIKGISPLFKRGKNHIITSITEHSSIFESVRELEKAIELDPSNIEAKMIYAVGCIQMPFFVNRVDQGESLCLFFRKFQ